MFYAIVKKIKEITAVWDSTEGLVTKSEVAEGTGTADGGVSYKYYGAAIAYEYRVDGVGHTGRTIYSDAAQRVVTAAELEAAEENEENEENDALEKATAFQDRNRSIVEDVAAQYPKGMRVKVFYNPKKPEQSYLEKVSGKSSAGYIAMLFFVGLVLTGFGVVMVLFILNGGEPLRF
jgi:hypothetical protein